VKGAEAELVGFLSDASSHLGSNRPVEHIETHISHVFLTDRYAYKLKKPVRFEFLDFSTPELRRQACEDEVRLNRRMAPDIYLDVLSVVRGFDDRLRLGGTGTPIDTVVKMRRLAAETSLEALVRGGRATRTDIDRLAASLARHYTTATPIITNAVEYLRTVERHVLANRDDLVRLTKDWNEKRTAELIQRVHAAQRRWLALWGDTLKRRACDGRIVEGHGDLRPDHICLTPQPVVIDCIEFSRELRVLDVADELAFLAIECERMGAAEIGTRVLDAYRRLSRDDVPEKLLCFYKSYRACVRAKVASLRAAQVSPSEAGRCKALAVEYFGLADLYSRRLGPVLLVVVRGLSGTGKSTLARALADSLELELMQTDMIRRQHFGSVSASQYSGNLYAPHNRQRIYDVMLAAAEERMAGGLSVILDGTFLSARQLAVCRELATRLGAELLTVECRCPEAIVRSRLSQRQQAGECISDATYETYRRQQDAAEPIPHAIAQVAVDTSLALPLQVEPVMQRLRELRSGCSPPHNP
jgi:aminoglycoside phosphotransferase family enzyme/predicted kinase